MRRYQVEFLLQVPEGAEDVDVFKRVALTTGNLLLEGSREEVRVVRDRLLVSCDAPDKDSAYKWALNTAVRFTRLTSMSTGQHFTPVFAGLDSVPGEAGEAILAPLVNRWWVDNYDATRFPEDVAASGATCSLTDEVLDRSLEYFQRGLFYRRVAWRFIHPLSPEGIFTASEATLNFHKAVATILGDDSNGARSHALGLDRELRRRITHLYRRRSERDVAHPTVDSSALEELVNTVAGSQEIARKVIEAYVRLLRTEGSLPAMRPAGRPRRGGLR